MNTHQQNLELTRRYLDGTATSEETRALEDALRTEAAFRRQFLRYANVDTALGSGRLSAAPVVASAQARRPLPCFGWLSWRPLTAAAAGIVFGLFCASVVWAYASPRVMAEARRLAALVDGSFESQPVHVAAGFPREAGVWSGDEAEVTSTGTAARNGKHMLRFLKADREPNSPNSPANACDVYQIVDLRPLREMRKSVGESTLELSAEFRDARDARTAASSPVIFRCHIYLFHGSADSLRSHWPDVASEALGTGSAYVLGSGDPDGGKWRRIAARCVLPPHADFCVLRLSAGRDQWNDGPVPELGRQFADDVRLILKTQPELPVRLVQP